MNSKLFHRTSAASQTLSPRQPTFVSQRLRQRICASWILPLLLLARPAVAHAQYSSTTNNGTITITAYTGPGGVVTIPSTINDLPVTSIGDSAFYFCTSLTSVTIPNSVTSIGNSAFQYCTRLTDVAIGSSVTKIGDWAFSDCYSLTRITVDMLNSVYGSVDGVLFDKSQTILIQCPEGKAGSYTIPSTVTNIGACAFYYCTRLTTATIPNGVTSIGRHAFTYCRSLTAITVDALNPLYSSVDGVLFNQSQTTLIQCPEGKAGSYTIPNSVTSIGDWAFSDCTNLTGVALGDSVASIGYEAFYDCYSLTTITVDAANSVYSSVDGVLFNQSRATLILYPKGKAGSYTIPSTVTHIGSEAFYHCAGLTTVTIPGSVTNIGSEAFYDCRSLTAIAVDAANPVYSSLDGVLFNQSQTTLILYPEGKAGSYTIPSAVTSIGSEAFYYCTNLATVTIPMSVTNIGSDAFTYCRSLTAITVDALNPVYSSVDGVLFNQSQTTLIQNPEGKAGSYTIPNRVTSIGDRAFYFCTSLTSVTIPNSVTSIGYEAFAFCVSLTGVHFQGNAPSVGSSIFASVNNGIVYYLPGTTGWEAMFYDRPTALWKPQAQTGDPSFGVRMNGFGFTITGASGMVIVVEASPSLVNPVWSPLQTNTLSGDTFYFSDPQWTNHPARLYRVRSP